MLPAHTKNAGRFVHYVTPCPQSHAECWAGNAPTTLDEEATVKIVCSSLSLLPQEGFTTSYVALMCGSSAAAKLVLDTVHAADSLTTSSGLTLLHAAALGGQPADVLQQLIRHGCSPTAKDEYGCSVMHCAASGGCVETMKFILANDCSVSDRDVAGVTVMMYAAFGGSVEAMKFLLENGGSLTDKDFYGETIMMAAARSGSIEVIQFILANGGSANDKDSSGCTVMMYAAFGDSIEALKLVLANGGNMCGVLRWCNSADARKFCLSCGGS